MKRLDVWLVELGLAPTRSKAQQMIHASEVELRLHGQWRTENSPSFKVGPLTAADVRVSTQSLTLKFVSRGGLKLEEALKRLQLNPSGWRCLDVGQSTGGFTDCLLQAGARAILGVDVGHGQLHEKIKADPRVIGLEGVNARDLTAEPRVHEWLREGVDLAVVDLSFIPIEVVFPALGALLPEGAQLVALVKPQFEVGPQGLSKGGIVTDARLFDEVQSRVLLALQKCGFKETDFFPSAVRGQDGNQEFFVHAVRS